VSRVPRSVEFKRYDCAAVRVQKICSVEVILFCLYRAHGARAARPRAPWSDLGASCSLWGAARSGRAPASSIPPASEEGFYLRSYEYRSKWRPALTKSS
jgi:hypothetical protein